MCTYVYVCVYAQSLSCVWLFATLWTVACQAPLSMEFSRQEYWRGLPFPTPGDLPDPGIELDLHFSHLLHWQEYSLLLCHLGHAKWDRWCKSNFSTSKCKLYHDVSLVFMNLSEFQGGHITPYLKSFLEGIINILRLQVWGVIVDSLPAEQKRKIHRNHVLILFYYNTSFLLASFRNESLHKSVVQMRKTHFIYRNIYPWHLTP